ncbi:hypothetical protein GS458_3125 [Geobacillus stearothermophilus]|nr:hypothetical protein GS458_3125 [Geobacillus stearothermophilus]
MANPNISFMLRQQAFTQTSRSTAMPPQPFSEQRLLAVPAVNQSSRENGQASSAFSILLFLLES